MLYDLSGFWGLAGTECVSAARLCRERSEETLLGLALAEGAVMFDAVYYCFMVLQ